MSRFAVTLALYVCLVPIVHAQTSATLDEKVALQMRELDRKLLEAHEKLDAEYVMTLFSKGADSFFIDPSGDLMKGPKEISQSWTAFFAALDWIHGEIKDVSYFREGDGVIAVGTVVYNRKLKNREPEQKVVIWTDYRRLENGNWVYVFRHAHWPVASNKPAAIQK
jgi:ketosteroid isomerase-like protein